jgi:hypothetical protein
MRDGFVASHMVGLLIRAQFWSWGRRSPDRVASKATAQPSVFAASMGASENSAIFATESVYAPVTRAAEEGVH